jgi:putative (di)nucleoside polyphosphate hydrolase
MLDRDGYRPNVGIIICNQDNQVFWAKRLKEQAWQFPQGGIKPGESPEVAMYRELHEEVNLQPKHVKILGRSKDWIRYDVPSTWIRRDWRDSYRGQKQVWFLLLLTADITHINVHHASEPEFDDWHWESYWKPIDTVVSFKREAYFAALHELAQYLPMQLPAHEASYDLYSQHSI